MTKWQEEKNKAEGAHEITMNQNAADRPNKQKEKKSNPVENVNKRWAEVVENKIWSQFTE